MSKTIKIKLFFFIITAFAVMVVAHSSEAKTLKTGEVYRSWNGTEVIEVVSGNELEISKGGDIILAQYTFKNSKLRIVLTVMGTKMVEYYELINEGLKDTKGNVLYSTFAFVKSKQKEKKALKQREMKELSAKLEEEQKAKIAREEKLHEIKTVNLDELSSAGASRIVVKSIIKLGNEQGKLKISPKGNYILYAPQGKQLVQIIETENFKTIKSFKINSSLSNAVWSPDGTKIAYCPGRNRELNIVDINSGKTIELPYPTYRCGQDEILWYSESEIYFHSDRDYFTFNLNTLEKHSLVGSVPIGLVNPLDGAKLQKRKNQQNEAEKQKKNIQKLFSTNLHKKAYIYQDDVKGVGIRLIVANKDDSYERVLIRGRSPYEASPKLRYVAFNNLGSAYIAFLGLREEPKTTFRLELDKTKYLNENQKEEFDEYFKGGTINGYFDKPQSFIIWGKVHSPEFNPLNNRVIGPDKDKFKGWVKFIESYDSFSIVKTTFEIKPIKEGDIVTTIRSNYINGRQFVLPSKIWAVLKYGNGDQQNKKEDEAYHANVNSDKSNLILGSWKNEFGVIEYFRDGTFMLNVDTGEKKAGKWSINGDTLALRFYIHPKIHTYKILELSTSSYKIIGIDVDKRTYNARRMEPSRQSPVYTTEKSIIHLSNPRVRMETNYGSFTFELNSQKAPKTVENFLQYARNGFYDGTIFHRVIKGSMIQGGGLDTKMQEKPARSPINNEAENGLKNLQGTIAMARLDDPHSATSQFFINTTNNAFLDYRGNNANGWGYCVFGKVVDGMDAVHTIGNLLTITKGGFHDVPANQVIIKSVIVENGNRQSNSVASENHERSVIANKVSSSVFTTNNSNIYHKSNCPELETKDLIEFSSPEKARKSGGAPCKICNPMSSDAENATGNKPGKSRTTYKWTGWKALFK
jgi:peptidyl-prolyl cis-trans isomerase B (cyclophilin B)